MPDYYDAAHRHMDDANHLFASQRYPNADQLFGLAAECSLKAVMLALGMPMKNNRPANRNHGHINVLWDEFITFAKGKGFAHYAAPLGTANPYSNWEVGHRYENASIVNYNTVFGHQQSAEIAFNCLTQAIYDGVV